MTGLLAKLPASFLGLKIKLWLAGGVLLLVAGLGAGLYLKGRSAGIESQRPKIEKLVGDLAVAKGNVVALQDAIDGQNKMIFAAGAATATAKAEIARVKAEAARRPKDPIVAALAKGTPGAVFCPVEDLNRRGWEKLQ